MLWLIAIFTYFTAASHLAQKYKKKCSRRKAKKPSLCVSVQTFPVFPIRWQEEKLRSSTLGRMWAWHAAECRSGIHSVRAIKCAVTLTFTGCLPQCLCHNPPSPFPLLSTTHFPLLSLLASQLFARWPVILCVCAFR